MKIFIVDDDAEQRMIMADYLANPRDSLFEFSHGAAMLEHLDESPDLILLDIEMPVLDGISACRQLRERGHTQVQVTFISAHDDLENRLAAYDAGGSDFVVKPFIPMDLVAKVEVARKLMARHASFASDIQLAQRTAFTAMSSMGELGVVLQFLRASFDCTSLDALAALVIETLKQYGLHGMVELRAGIEMKNCSSYGECTPLESSVLSHAKKMERIFRFRSHMAVNYPQVTIVILNLPADEERVGRLRDHLAVLAEGADARIAALLTEQIRQKQAQAIHDNASALTDLLAAIDHKQADHRVQMLAVGAEYLNELSRAFAGLGLSEGQESRLYAMAQQAAERTSAIVGDSNDIATQLRGVVARLREIA